MTFVIVGLGNPGAEYENTRHNAGRIVLEVFRKANAFPDWIEDKKKKMLVSSGAVNARKVFLAEPETFMNRSGEPLRGLIKSKKDAERLVVIHDDLDIPFGSYKISFNKSSGGHKGVESIIKALKTQTFVRIRIGISPLSPILKKPKGKAAVEKTILGKFTPDQLAELKRLAKRIAEGLVCLMSEGREKAMSQYGR